jgi:20S proteasome alpha/beta subunit
MQAVAIHSEQGEREVTANDLSAWRRRVTYQLILCGHDGVVLASDRREMRSPGPGDEGDGPAANMVQKIRIDPTGQFAWAFSGGETSIVAAGLLERECEASDLTSENVERKLKNCGDRSWSAARGPNTGSEVILVDGRTQQIFRARLSPMTTIDRVLEGRCIAGQSFSKASLFPQRYYSPKMSVDQLAVLAGYTVITAHKMDTVAVDGLDLVIYRNSVGRFEFANPDLYRETAVEIDQEISALFQNHAQA